MVSLKEDVDRADFEARSTSLLSSKRSIAPLRSKRSIDRFINAAPLQPFKSFNTPQAKCFFIC
jgi:hypothetical protein